MTSLKFKSVFALSTCFALISPFQSKAQFNKYKSKTKYETNNEKKIDTSSLPKSTTSAKNLKSINENSNNNDEDAFGRSSKIIGTSSLNKDKKYVNLNPETAFGPEVVTSFDFPDTSLQDLTMHMQKLTGMNLILDKELKGKVSITAPTPITVGDAWKAYLTALNMNGYTLVESGAFYKIVNARDIRYTPTKIYTGNYSPDTENYVMRIIPLKNIDSTEVTRSFRPFMSRYGRVVEIKQTNTIIVQDTGDNINRLVRLIKFIDVPGHEETLQIIPVKNSSAQEIAKLLDTILQQKGKSKSKRPSAVSSDAAKGAESVSKIIAEPRTNSIIAMANAEGAKKLRELINKLDVKLVNNGANQIHVYYLNYGDSETLSKTLSSLVSDAKPNSKKGSSRFSQAGAEDGPALFNAEVKITADKDNNALVVTASPTDYLTIKNVIQKLDIPRDQVYVEGMIMETQVNNGKGFGISILGAYGAGGLQKAGFAGGNGSTDLLNVISNNITSLGGLFVGGGTGSKITQTVAGQEVTINSVNGLITAIANNSNTNVLATPQILALDNTEASFEVAESVPVTEQTIANNQTSLSVRQQKAALTLKITPQINKVTRFVKLKIDQKIEAFNRAANAASSGGLATTSRAAVTTVVVRDRDTIAMGGLMRDQSIESTSKVPLLGDIPILGYLFRNYEKTEAKVNMLFFLTPKIMDSYQKTVASTVKDVLNRRSAQLKDVVGEEDPYAPTVKGLYQKAKKQEKGPLYDEEDARRYKKENEKIEGISNQGELVSNEIDTPNYKEIAQKVNLKKSSIKK